MTRSWIRYRTLAAAAALVASRARAQATSPDTATLTPVVVTATRAAPVTLSPVSTTVITGADLRARGLATVQDALRTVPGALVTQTGSFGGLAALYLRGGASDYVAVLIDGVPVNDPGGAIDLANLTTDDVDRIEVVRGPASVLYGTDAISGVVQIFTRDGRGARRLDLAARGGTYGTRDLSGALVAGSASAGLSVAGAHHATRGIYAFNSGWRDDVLSAAARASGPRGDVGISVRYLNANTDIPTTYWGAVQDSDQFHRERRWTASAQGGIPLGSRLTARVQLGLSDVRTRSANLPDSPGDTLDPFSIYDSRDRLTRLAADARLEARLAPAAALTAGASWERQRERAPGPPHRRDDQGLYAQLAGGGAAWSYAAGLRGDHSAQFGTFVSSRASGAWRLAPDTRVRASVGTAFKAPTFYEAYSTDAFALGNPSLEPERTRSWDAGVEQRFGGGRAMLAATWFDQRFRDLIQFDASTPSGQPNYVNIGAATASGLELEGRVDPVTAISIDGAYTWLRTRVTEPGPDSSATALFVQGRPLLRRPTHLATAGVSYRPAAGTTLRLDVMYVGARDDLFYGPPSFGTRVRLPAYTRTDVSGEVALPTPASLPALALTARVENLFGVRYQQIYNFGAPGRVVLVGVRAGVGL